MRSTIRHIHARLAGLATRAEAGMSTAEYAIGTVAAASFAALLLAIVKEGTLKTKLLAIITQALGVAG